MPVSPVKQATLDFLLEHIRQRGIPVGTKELQRLQAVLATSPALSRTELRELIATLLAKDQYQHRTICRVFEWLVPYEKNESLQPLSDTTTSKTPLGSQSTSASDKGDKGDKGEREDSLDEITSKKSLYKWFLENIWILGISMIVVALITFLTINIKYKTQEKKHTEANSRHTERNQRSHHKETETPAPEEDTPDLTLAKTLTLWTPEYIGTKKYPLAQKSWQPMLLLVLSSLGFFWLLQKAMTKTRRREVLPIHILKRGRTWIPPLKTHTDYHLLSSHARREMGWGISHYHTDQPLNKLDIPRSVEACAKSGFPSLHFSTAQRERKIYLWQDRSSDNPDLSKLALEITQTLQAINIYLQPGYFHSLPNLIKSEHGETIWSTRHEYPESQPLVVVLIDYDSLTRLSSFRNENRNENSDKKTNEKNSSKSHTTFQLLSHWENLCIVDCSHQSGRLCRHLSAYPLDCLLPQEIADWLAKQGGVPQACVTDCQPDDLHQWAMACSLPNRPLMEAEIRALHEALGLECAWQYHQLGRYARQAANGFDFSQQRTRLLNELSQLEFYALEQTQEYAQKNHSGEGNKSNKRKNRGNKSLLNNCVHFWLQRNQDINQLSSAQEATRPWKNTNRQHRLKLDTALLQLWLQATKGNPNSIQQAADTLYDLHQNQQGKYSLNKEVERQLGQYTCQNWDETLQDKTNPANHKLPYITLPHDWQDLSVQIQHQLKTAGLGGKPQHLRIGWNLITSLILGSLLGLTLASGWYTYQRIKPVYVAKSIESQQLIPVSYSPEPTGSDKESLINREISSTKWVVGDRKNPLAMMTTEKNHHSDKVLFTWHKQPSQRAQVQLEQVEDTELWRLGQNPYPPHPDDGVDLSVAIIKAMPDNASARQVAARLLDSGTADLVILGNQWRQYLTKLGYEEAIKPLRTQLLFIHTEIEQARDANWADHAAWFDLNLAELLTAINHNKKFTQAVLKKDMDAEILTGSPVILGLKTALINVNKNEVDLPNSNGIKLIRIPKGSFQMGSETGASDEKPAHSVTIATDFYMSQTEVTFDQYDAYTDATKKDKRDDEGWGRGNRPVINVSWNDTQAYLTWLTSKSGQTCRLPSEAEWEYAARAGTTSDYPWGDEASHEKANYGKEECCEGIAKGKDQWVNTAPVGSFDPNSFGLYDLHGNVYEWVQDCYADYSDQPGNAEAHEEDKCSGRVLRGGSWFNSPDLLRSSDRYGDDPDDRNYFTGFRVVCVLPSAEN